MALETYAITLIAALCAASPALAQSGDYGGGYTGGGPPSTTYTVPVSPLPPLRYDHRTMGSGPVDPFVEQQIDELRQRNRLLLEQSIQRSLERMAR